MKGYGVVTQGVTLVRRRGEGRTDLKLNVGAMDSNVEPGEHFYWPVPELKVGDTVSLQVVEAESADPASLLYPADPKARSVSQATVLKWEMNAALKRAAQLKKKIAALTKSAAGGAKKRNKKRKKARGKWLVP